MQEAKVEGGRHTAEAEQSARASKWTASLEPCVVNQGGGKSAGVAVAVRNHSGMSKPAPMEIAQPYLTEGRFIMRRVGAMMKGGVHVGSLYLKDMVGPTAKCNLGTLHFVTLALKGLRGPWCIGGDRNCTPAELEATGWLKLVGGVIVASPSATCNFRTIDFFVVSRL